MFVMLSKMPSRLGSAFGAALLLAACASTPAPVKSTPVVIKPAETQPRPVQPPPAPRPTPILTSKSVPAALEPQIQEIWRTFPGRTGIAITSVDDGWSVEKRGQEYFPQQSVSKLWVAMTVLDQVDSGKLRLTQMVRIGKEDLTLFNQPIRARVLANGSIEESVLSLLEQSITKSDCTANDSLLRTAGGPAAVRAFIAKKGLGAIRFGDGERLMQSKIAGIEWRQEYSLGNGFEAARAKLSYAERKAALDRYLADPYDGASPMAIANALARLSKMELLSPDSSRLLLSMLERTTTGPNRLKGGLPPDWRIGHKTGSGQVLDPVSTGTNDVGIIVAPDGKRYTIAVMISDTTIANLQRMQMMQAVSRAVVSNHR